MDGAGEIVELGESVVGYRPGDRVVLHVLPNWRAGPTPLAADRLSRGFNLPGSLAEFVSVPAHSVVRIPEHLSFEEAATLPTAALPSWNGVRGANVGPDSTV
jgi:NADPH:quinone reductase-like Zn-dependent oxidoreductase